MQLKHLTLVIGILIVAVVVLATLVLQLENWVNVLANISEIYLFGVMLPTLSFAFTLIYKGLTNREPSGSTNPVTTTIEQKSIENLQPLPEGDIFQSSLRPNQQFFHPGDPVLFWARYKGKIIDGYLATYIKKPDGKFEAIFDLSTGANPLTGKGKLNGEKVEAEGRWSWTFPVDCKLGPYEFFIHAGNHFPPSSMWIRIKALAIHILWPSRTDFAKGSNQAIAGNWEKVEVVE